MADRVLLIGGHGKVAQHMTPLLLRGWNVTSMVRNPEHADEITSKNKDHSGKLNMLIHSLDDITSESDAKAIIDEVKPTAVIWTAGAGGKGGPSRTYAIDRDAAQHFITACARTPQVRKFLMISWIGSRRTRAPWWTDEDEASNRKIWTEVLPDYAKAKLDTDECLVGMAAQRKDWQGICLRPGILRDEGATGKVLLGRTPARGGVTRADVADIAVRLLESDRASGYYDLLNGEESASDAVARVLREKIDCIEGEDVDAIVKKYKL